MSYSTVYGLVGGFTLSHLDDDPPSGHPIVKKEPEGRYQHFISLDEDIYFLKEANPGQFIVFKRNKTESIPSD